MAGNENRRQKKLAKKKARHKKNVLHKKKLEVAGGVRLLSSRLALAANGPIHECLAPEPLFDIGIGHVVISRRMADGQLGVCSFLLDVYCLGVKDADFNVFSEYQYNTLFGAMSDVEDLRSISPACARKVVEDAVAYAEDLGIPPHPSYKLAKQIFGDIDVSACGGSYEFGRDGEPFYVSGPNETLGDIRRIINTLNTRLGPDGFDYLISDGSEFQDIE